ncbi:hypothetical protein [Piscirickettsia salmonis]|uniref:hypothetical protein n=1 Tax=Piscirickettsia salmonis TaxID=1238 RepID=UPI000B2BC918|nr:hypothetical protein [Piscirickettsia salmonis]
MSESIGALSEIYRDSDNAGNYVKLANITNIGEISSSRDKIDVTEYGSTQKKYKLGLKDHDEIQLDMRKRRYLGRYFAHPMMQNRRAKRDDYKPSAVRVTQRCVP